MKYTLLMIALLTGLAVPANAQLPNESTVEKVQERIVDKIDEVVDQVDQDVRAQQARENILQPIYDAAQYLSFPAFHWIAFSLMVTGFVSFALQLVLGKLLMLTQFHFSPTEILADSLGFVISAIGLILTTQAATDNSNFTQSPAMVLSAAGVGLVLGLIFYIRGQTQEWREARELRRKTAN